MKENTHCKVFSFFYILAKEKDRQANLSVFGCLCIERD